MNKQDIDNLIRWAVDTDLKTFSEDAYGVTGTAFYRSDDYLKGKFRLMQRDFIRWIAQLGNRDRLIKAINNKGE